MTEQYFPFDTGAGASLSQDQWSQMAKYWNRPGVPGDNLGGSLRVSTTGATLTTQVSAGEASFLGYFYYNNAPIVITHPANSSGKPRIDVVVLRLEMDNDKIYVATAPITGTPADNPVPPAIAGNWATLATRVWEMPLGYVRVESGATTISGSKINDARWPGKADITTGTSANRPDWSSLFRPAGSMHYEYDTRTWMGFDGFKWGVIGQQGPWKTYTPVITWDANGVYTTDTGWSTNGRYKLLADNTCAVTVRATMNHLLPAAVVNPGFLQVSLPFKSAAYGLGNDSIIPVYAQSGANNGQAWTGFGHVWSGSKKVDRMYLQGNTDLDSWTDQMSQPTGTLFKFTATYEIDGI